VRESATQIISVLRFVTFRATGFASAVLTTGRISRASEGFAGASAINVDGIFGPRTRSAVLAFQKQHGLRQDGVIGRDIWGKLVALSNTTTVDVVDETNPGDIGVQASAIRSAGGSPIIMQGMCNGVVAAMHEVASRARSKHALGVVVKRKTKLSFS
jgi:peptidoglycan hydrolase-like protein with peptidoglycan-binding domain